MLRLFRSHRRAGHSRRLSFSPRLEELDARIVPAGLPPYVSPYTIGGVNPDYVSDIGGLTDVGGHLNTTLITTAATTPDPDWYTDPTNSWGPQPWLQPAPTVPGGVVSPTQYFQQRIVATAAQFTNSANGFEAVPYQHHHNPLWNPFTTESMAPNVPAPPATAYLVDAFQNSPPPGMPPAGQWRWEEVSNSATLFVNTPVFANGTWTISNSEILNPYGVLYGVGPNSQPGPNMDGLDCSDLTAVTYNAAAGIYINSAVGMQGLFDSMGNFVSEFNSQSLNNQPVWNMSGMPHALFPPTNDPDFPEITPIQIAPSQYSGYSSAGNYNYVSHFNEPASLDLGHFQPGDLLYIASNIGAPVEVAGTSANMSTMMTVVDATGLSAGMDVHGPGIAQGTKIQSIAGTNITLTHQAGAGAGMGTFAFSSGSVSHVVIWLGLYGTLANGDPTPVPLVISSHDNTPAVFDDNGMAPTPGVQMGTLPPPGVHVLPFEPNGWFYQNYSHAMRLLPTFAPIATSLTATANPNPVSSGLPATVTATLTAPHAAMSETTPTGTVTFSIGSTILGSTSAFSGSGTTFTATFTTTQIPAGAQSITATYSGDGYFQGSSATVTSNVVPVILAAGSDMGAPPNVTVYGANTQTQLFSFFAFDPGFLGGVRVAVGDINGDGVADIICGAGPGADPHVMVYSGVDLSVLASFEAFDIGFRGGVYVAAGQLDADPAYEIIVGAGAGAGPNVCVFDYNGGTIMPMAGPLGSFWAFAQGFTGGVRVAAGNFDGQPGDEIIAGAGPGAGPQVNVFNANASALIGFFAFSNSFSGGVFVAGGDLNNDGADEIIVSAGSGVGGVNTFASGTAALLASFSAFNTPFNGGARVAIVDLQGDGQDEIAVSGGPGGGPAVQIFNGETLENISRFFAFDSQYLGGVFIGGR